MKNLLEELLYETVQKVCGSPQVTYQGKEIDWTPPFRTITYYDVLKEVLGVDVRTLSEADLKSLIPFPITNFLFGRRPAPKGRRPPQ